MRRALLASMVCAACGATPAPVVAPTITACGGTPVREELPPLVVEIEEVTGEEVDPLVRREIRLVGVDVAERRQREHGALPQVERTGEVAPDAWPMVTVKNDTPHGLVVWFAGPCPRTVALLPGAEHAVEFCEGRYDIAAELSADGFLPFVGEGDELQNGYGYRVSFYVIAEPRTRTRIRRR
jgi:hypothetical protein